MLADEVLSRKGKDRGYRRLNTAFMVNGGAPSSWRNLSRKNDHLNHNCILIQNNKMFGKMVGSLIRRLMIDKFELVIFNTKPGTKITFQTDQISMRIYFKKGKLFIKLDHLK